MRGDLFHNRLTQKARTTFEHFRWRVSIEHRFQANETTTYFDLLAVNGHHNLACEIETTPRHAMDNAQKAQAVGIPLWFVVPTRKVKRQIADKLKAQNLTPGGERIKVLLLSELENELARCQAWQKPGD
ncbi:MAG: hypothetical protein ACYTEK_15635 [Planctomycetota bacterium]|jgi:hypothetical protein